MAAQMPEKQSPEKKILRRHLPDTLPDLGSEIPPLLQRLYAARGVQSPEQLSYTLRELASPARMRGVDRAVEVLADAIAQQRSIMILGDFDADGATSTAVAVLGLRMMGAATVDFRVPSRFSDGYGLTPGIIAKLAEDNALPDLMVTVDNGIAAIEGVAEANRQGVRVVVTDHHLAGDRLPDAAAIVNPNQPGCEFLSKCAAGVGVIFYVLTALRRYMSERDLLPASQQPNLAQLLDLVALGTVADVVPLDHNNRIFVEQGLRRIRQRVARPGILALLEVAGREPDQISATDLGFVIGPRLNAAGRMDDMSIGIRCLLTDDPQEAKSLAQDLDDLNRDRRSIEGQMKKEAESLVAQMQLDGSSLPWGLVLFEPLWHQGVIGILASRIREQTHRPVIAFALNDEKTEIKGSARSIPGLHIRDALALVDSRHPGLLKKFGGHAMAAGMTLAPDDLDTFSRAFDEAVRASIKAEDLEAALVTDGELGDSELTLDTAQLLRRAGPWGQHFPEPSFDGEFEVLTQRIVGAKHLKMVVRPRGSDLAIDAIAFNTGAQVPDYTRLGAKMVFRPDANHFRGQTQLQLLVEYLQPAQQEP